MPQEFTLSRRKALAALGTVGAASAGAGLGTSAFFSDEESFQNNRLVAGELDMHAAYSAHYSDWSPEDGAGVTVRMWDGPTGTAGSANDLESGETGLPLDDAWLIAVDDPETFLANTQYAADGTTDCDPGTDAEDLTQPVIDFGDVKPGDFGEVTFDFALCDNPGYVWFVPTLRSAGENGVTEPEADDPDEGDDVELLDAVRTAVWVDDGDDYQDDDETPTFVGSLRQLLSMTTVPGIEFGGDLNAEAGGGTGEQGCFSATTTHSAGFAWWLPVDHGNEVQSDSATLDLSFYTEQCRHNDGAGIDCTLDSCTRAFLLDEPTDLALMDGLQWDGETVADTTTVRVGTGVAYDPFGVAPFGFDPAVTCVEAGTTVRWEWVDQTEVNPAIPETVHHNVIIFEFPDDMDGCDTATVDPATVVNSGHPVGHDSARGVDEPSPFEHTFADPGVYPYYCEPHGAPEAFPNPDETLDDYHHPPGRPELDEPQNLLGMRGTVIVTE
ncbi:plastocyanin/azurin family copper-binding protein [Haloplanus natans]|uniref:plastocyanin/azurin family copper-binding protein n=1 Tax=Haloplanus natans TaxID=376171 RepID=UPI0012F99213|nr:plastocyanin/azurin family copper-binding protein [Haloplanus natans]